MQKETLLELVESCTVVTPEGKIETASEQKFEKVRELRELGFTQLADKLEEELIPVKLNKLANYKYVKITDREIQAFLDKKAKRYNDEHLKKKEEETNKQKNPQQSTSGLYDTYGSLPKSYRELIEKITIEKKNSENTQSDVIFLESKQNPNLFSGLSGYFNRNDSQLQQMEQLRQLSQSAAQSLSELRENWENDHLSPFLQGLEEAKDDYPTFTAKTCDYWSTEEGTIGQYVWAEKKLGDYDGIPPKDVIETLKEQKERKLFDYFTIASVKGIRDPLLLGRIKGIKDRFFITQWGDDINLCDLI